MSIARLPSSTASTQKRNFPSERFGNSMNDSVVRKQFDTATNFRSPEHPCVHWLNQRPHPRPVESSVRSNGSFERCLGALKPPDLKFQVAFGSGLVGWAPVPEELIKGGTGADRMCDQRFDGGDSLVRVHVELLALQPDSSCTTVDEM